MDNNPFAKFGQENYALKLYARPEMNKWFQKMWGLYFLLTMLIVAAVLVSILVAHDNLPNIFRIIQMIWSNNGSCDINLSTAAACMIFFNGALLIPFLIVLTTVAYLLSSVSRFVPSALFEIAQFGELRPKDGAQVLENQHSQTEDGDSRKKEMGSVWKTIKGNFRIKPHNINTYVDDFENSLLSPWRYVIFPFWLLICYTLSIKIVLEVGLQDANLTILVIAGYFFVIIIPFLVAYFVTMWTWLFFVVGYYLRWIPKLFNFEINPKHGDNCGGLKRLGDICLQMAFTITLPAILLGLWWSTGTVTLVSREIPSFELFTFLMMVILLVLAFWAFFQPLLGFHDMMARTKARYFDEASSKISVIESRLRELFAQGKYDSEETQEQIKRLEIVKALYPTDMKFPTWPFSTVVLLGFFTTQILPVIGAVTAIVEFMKLLGYGK